MELTGQVVFDKKYCRFNYDQKQWLPHFDGKIKWKPYYPVLNDVMVIYYDSSHLLSDSLLTYWSYGSNQESYCDMKVMSGTLFELSLFKT